MALLRQLLQFVKNPYNQLGFSSNINDRLHIQYRQPWSRTVVWNATRTHRTFPSAPPSSFAGLWSAEHHLVNLNASTQLLATRELHRRPIAVQHRPCGLVTAEFQRAFERQRGDATFDRYTDIGVTVMFANSTGFPRCS